MYENVFLRVKKHIICYVYQKRDKILDDCVKHTRVPIEHLFNLYEWCDTEWYWEKSLNETQENMMSHVRESHRQNLGICAPCTDDLVVGATTINGNATIPSATVANFNAAIPNNINAGTPVVNLVTGTTVVNSNATYSNGLVAGFIVINCDTTIRNGLVTDAIVVNGDATTLNSLVAGTTSINGNTTICNYLVTYATVINTATTSATGPNY